MITAVRAGLATCVLLSSCLLLHAGLSAQASPLPSPEAGPPEVEPAGSLFVEPLPIDVVRGFDPPQRDWLAGHRGVDLAASHGAPIRSAGEGIVAFAGTVVDRPTISIDHSIGIRTTYEPVESELRRGDRVAKGQVIGVLAHGNGHCAEPCLHWGARIGQKTYLDPLKLLSPYSIRLYPPEPWGAMPAGAPD